VAGTQRTELGEAAQKNAEKLDDAGNHDAATDACCEAARDFEKAAEDFDAASNEQLDKANAILQQGWQGNGRAVARAAELKSKANEAVKRAAGLCQKCGERSLELGNLARAAQALLCAQKFYIRLGDASRAALIGKIIELLQQHGLFQRG